jgi:hypothetical protein
MFLFNPTLYGTVYGIFTLSSIIFTYLMQPMYSYNVANDDYFAMNMILAVCSLGLLLVPLAHHFYWKKIEKKYKTEETHEF